MKNSTVTRQKAPPLWVWPAAAAIAIALSSAVFAAVLRVEYRFAEFDGFNISRMDSFLSQTDIFRVVVAGDSRVRYTVDAATLKDQLSELLEKDVVVFTTSANTCT